MMENQMERKSIENEMEIEFIQGLTLESPG